MALWHCVSQMKCGNAILGRAGYMTQFTLLFEATSTQNVIQPSELRVFGNGRPSSLLFEERHQPSRGRLCCLDILVIHSLHDRLSGRQTKSSLSSYDAQPKLVLRTLQLFTETYASRQSHQHTGAIHTANQEHTANNVQCRRERKRTGKR
jgi:hypothetical protein